MKAIVVDANYGSVNREELDYISNTFQKADIEVQIEHFETEEEIIQGCRGADAILATGNPPLTKSVLEQLPSLKYIQRFGIGVNSIDLEAATRFGKIVLNIPGFCATELADLAMSMILSLVRNTGFYDREIRKGYWPKCQYLLPPNLRRLTIGFFGFGQSAQELYRIVSRGYGMKVIACDPYLPYEIKEKFSEVEFIDFQTLLKNSDIISIHVGLSQETFHIWNEEAFEEMKNNAILINTSRGPIIDTSALIYALEQGKIRGAGLDTFEEEPISQNSPLLQMDNVVLSPHCGSYGEEAKREQIESVCRLIPRAVQEGRVSVKNVANKSVINTLRQIRWEEV